MFNKKRYCMVGASNRGYGMYASTICSPELSNYAELVGIYDTNIGRSRYVSEHTGGTKVYEDFDEMLRIEKPDAVIVTCVDAYHHEYVIRALEAGCDAITEKPMTIDGKKARAILETEKRTGKKVYVTHNCRFMPHFVKIKELIKQGAIGEIYSVHYEWNLKRAGHGTSYFYRWNRYLSLSGGLLCHKSSHHFDLANWFVDSRPVKVSAFGKLNVYGKSGDHRGKRCTGCEHASACEFYSNRYGSDFAKEFYLNNEKYDGYIVDSCVFTEDIDSYDTVSLTVQYENGVSMSYSLNATSPYEGMSIIINGSKGRLESEQHFTGMHSKVDHTEVRVYDLNGGETVYNIPKLDGSHGGGDERLRRMLFVGDIEDPLNQMSSSIDGATSILIGAAANESIKTGETIDIDEYIGDPSLIKK